MLFSLFYFDSIIYNKMLRHSRDPYNRYHMDYFTKGASAVKKTTEIKIENNLEKPEIIENNTSDFSIGVTNNFSDYIRKLFCCFYRGNLPLPNDSVNY